MARTSSSGLASLDIKSEAFKGGDLVRYLREDPTVPVHLVPADKALVMPPRANHLSARKKLGHSRINQGANWRTESTRPEISSRRDDWSLQPDEPPHHHEIQRRGHGRGIRSMN